MAKFLLVQSFEGEKFGRKIRKINEISQTFQGLSPYQIWSGLKEQVYKLVKYFLIFVHSFSQKLFADLLQIGQIYENIEYKLQLPYEPFISKG